MVLDEEHAVESEPLRLLDIGDEIAIALAVAAGARRPATARRQTSQTASFLSVFRLWPMLASAARVGQPRGAA